MHWCVAELNAVAFTSGLSLVHPELAPSPFQLTQVARTFFNPLLASLNSWIGQDLLAADVVKRIVLKLLQFEVGVPKKVS